MRIACLGALRTARSGTRGDEAMLIAQHRCKPDHAHRLLPRARSTLLRPAGS
ncbi:MAG: hypothetical protein AVDCRST_MAG88-2173 [uncultured Thermomicrobiales bacterium]|uniref:Uncharacterized protein n=1 Tax=uncultured Thermomicrobiales bacterium TaxID=1645740 RepID=A0A6J4V617_9BACT|nr:MAG: hypothetical protein AVDCRST_MAG88-2173 [uncultured Thermomicrobiales bacterium]